MNFVFAILGRGEFRVSYFVLLGRFTFDGILDLRLVFTLIVWLGLSSLLIVPEQGIAEEIRK